jgi:predicted  nucleic acid-binding Zn-ribbon protein
MAEKEISQDPTPAPNPAPKLAPKLTPIAVEKPAEKIPEKVIEKVTETIEVQKTPVWLGALAGIALCVSGITAAYVVMLQSHVTATETSLNQATIENNLLKEQLNDTNLKLKAQGQTLAEKVGLTEKQLDDKSNQLVAVQKNAQAAAAKLAQHQMATDQTVEAVKTEVAAVKTDVSAVKTDVVNTQLEQQAIKKSVAKVASDTNALGDQIATNRTELKQLKARGDKQYYEFAIEKGAPAINLSTIKLSAKMVDEKHNKFTLVIGSDDKNIEKDNQSLNQAIQFYSGKNPEMFEVVINGISKRMISGYLAVPKDAPKPIQ